MDELLQNLEQATNPDPSIQSSLAQYINLQIQNPAFGDILFQILQNEYSTIPPHIISICCNILKLWAKVQWERLDYDKKCFFFESLKKLLLNEHPAIDDLSIVFIDVAMHSQTSSITNSIENSRCYECHVYDFFNRISANPPIQQLHALTNIIYFISRSYKRSTSSSFEGSEPTLLFTRVCNVFIPLFHNQELVTTSEGSEILFMSLSIFKSFFFHTFIQKVTRILKLNESQAPSLAKSLMDKAIIPINFAQNVLSSFAGREVLDFRLVAHCCRFLNSFYKLTIFKNEFHSISSENENFVAYFKTAEYILQLNFSVLSFALEVASSDTFLIPSILKVFETFRKSLPPQIEMLNIILSSSQLTPVDKEEFFNSPNIFYLNVYEKFKESDLNAAPQFSMSIIYSMVEKNIELLLYMISLPIEEEHLIRCIAYCLPLISDLEQENYEAVLNELNKYYISLLQKDLTDPIRVAARLYFLYHFVPYLPKEQQNKLMEEVVSHYFGLVISQIKTDEGDEKNKDESNFNGYAIVSLISCELFKRLIEFDIPPFSFELALQTLVTFHSFCFTPIVIDSIRLLVSKEREKIIPFAESIIEKVFISFNTAFSQFLDAAGDAKQIDDATESISSNLSLFSMLIESSSVSVENEGQVVSFSSSCLIKPDLLPIIQVIFENQITDCNDELVHLLSVIFATDSPLIPQFVQLWFSFALSKEWIGFIDQLIEPFFSLISNSPRLFIELHITEPIEEVCLTYLIDQSNLSCIESVHCFASLLAWICLINSDFDPAPEFQLIQYACNDFCSSEDHHDSNIVLIASMFDIMASLTVSRKVPPLQPILNAMLNIAVKQNWILKPDQKRLYSIFMLTLILLSKNEINQNEGFYNSLLFEAFKLLNEEFIQRNLGNADYFEKFDGNIPSELEFLTEEESSFQSPQEHLNVTEILTNIIPLFNAEFVQSLKEQFSDIFSQLLS